MIIEQPAIYLRWLYPKAYWRMDRHEKAVYLTFDDGPIPEATPFILDTLKEYGAKATFFMVGDNVRKHPELYDRIATTSRRPTPISTATTCARPTAGCAWPSTPGSAVSTRS